MYQCANVPMYQCANVPMIQFIKLHVYGLIYEVLKWTKQ
jgi:hypothetical protein